MLKKLYHRDLWKTQLFALKATLDYSLPNRAGYPGSLWASWENRVSKGHSEEARILADTIDQLSVSPQLDPYDIHLFAADDHWQLCRLSNSMYAALIVSLWAEIEEFLKSLIFVYFTKNKQKFERKKFSDAREISEFFSEKLCITLCKLPQFRTVNAVRILNNCYKHNSGYYEHRSENEHINNIDSQLLTHWKISDRSQIDYTSIPIHEAVFATNEFCGCLLEQVTTVLTSHAKTPLNPKP